ncbi:MAG TPA: hypothetical protein VM925_04605 [Labilithrix sp.]|nr:hypothetical protein [Labilithrix sp.]
MGDRVGREGTISTERAEKLAELDRSTETAPAPERGRVAEPEGPSPFAQILRGLGREMDRGEKLMKGAVRGATGGQELGNGELLALQAGVYRYSEAVDLSAKLVDRAASGVKTVLQGQ